MKKALAAAGLGAALTVGSLTGAGAATASGSDTFLVQINSYGWHENTPGYLLGLGYRTYSFLNAGYSWNSVVRDVYNSTDWATTWSDSNHFVSLANSTCAEELTCRHPGHLQ